MKNSNVRFCEYYDLQWKRMNLRFLALDSQKKNLKDTVDLNHNDKLLETRKLLLIWPKRLFNPTW